MMVEPRGSRQINAYVCLGVTFAAAILTMGLRLTARRLLKVPLWWDDWLGITAFLFAVVWAALVFWWLQLGLGLFLNEITRPAEWIQERSRLILWNIEIFYAFSLAFSKLSILAFYWRMFNSSNIKKPIIVLASCAIVWLVLRTFMAIFHCVPVNAFWDLNVKGTCNINDSEFFFGTVLAHLIIDIAILILPVMQIRQLQLPIAKKVAVIGMFMFGIFVCIASIVVLVESLKYDAGSPEIPWNISPIIIWATAEVNLAIVSASLPMLRPIYKLLTNRPLAKNSSSSRSRSGYNHQSSGAYNPATSLHATKLGTITVKRHSNEGDDDDNSTYKLAGGSLQREDSISSNSEYYAHDGGILGPSTVITGKSSDGAARRVSDPVEGLSSGLGGIMVTNEIGVKVSRAK